MKLACVVHRYGPEVAGGSEAHCRAVAQHLSERHDVTVLTSCARDYISWANALPAGATDDGRVRVHRFPADRPRRLARFWLLSDLVFAGRATEDEQIAWFRENGPNVSGLLDHLDRRGREYDRVLFWSFRYFPTWFGLPLVADRAILVPTAEDDALIRASTLVGSCFTRPRALLFLTPEERDLVSKYAAGPLPPSAVIGAGLDPVPTAPARAVVERIGIDGAYFVYVGRVDKNKGCDRLFDAYLTYAAQAGSSALPLVLAGPVVLPVPAHPLLRALGQVDDGDRDALVAHARALVMPSRYESLSLVVLEAWNHGTPVVVNGRCQPLRGQVTRADGGLYYELPEEFVEVLRYLAADGAKARRFGQQGLAYVDREYRWNTVMRKVEALLGV